MPWNDGIDRKFCFSITDFHEFEACPFRFFVYHHLGKKYELSEGSESLALGCLLDQTIKIFHSSRSYGCSPDYIENLIKAAYLHIKEKVAKQSSVSFYSGIEPFLTPELCAKATEIFKNYYLALDKKIKPSLGEVGFCEWIIKGEDGERFKLWGGPDAIELGDDGVAEIVDYKSRENIEAGKAGMDMDLMPKIYILLCLKKLEEKGYKKARFIVRFWQDPKEDGFFEDFDLSLVTQFEDIFEQKISKILATSNLIFCDKAYCKACSSEKRGEYLRELETKKLIQLDDSILFNP